MRLLVLILFPLIFALNVSAAEPKESKSILQIRENLKKVEKSIEVTKSRMKNPQEIQFLPDLYFMLADLYSDKSRYLYSLKLELNPKAPKEELDFTAEKRPKLEAIETYKSLVDRYPQYANLDKAMFALAHEYREMGDLDNALKVYKQLLDKFPKSQVGDETQIIVGNIYFDKKDFEFALDQYLKVISRKTGSMVPVAHYKAAMAYIYLDKFLNSMLEFDKVFNFDRESLKSSEDLKTVDIREEALIASVWPITELKPEELAKHSEFVLPMEYYKKVAFDKASYRRVMARLGRRLTLKIRHQESALAWFEVLKLADDSSQRRDAMENFYQSNKAAKQRTFPAESAGLVAKTLFILKSEKQLYKKYEPLLRDIVTSNHNQAMKTKREDDLLQAVEGYNDYLWVFEDSKFREEMEINKAEAYFHAAHFVEAGLAYFDLSKKVKNPKKKKDFLASSIQSYIESFRDFEKLSSLDKLQGRFGFRTAAGDFLKKFPTDSNVPKIAYNLGKSLYDEQNYADATEALRKYLTQYPADANAKQASLLLLDCYYVRDDLKGLVEEAKSLITNYSLSRDIKDEIKKVSGQAQLKNVRSIAGDFSSKDYADKFLQFAKNNSGSNLNEPALFEAFTALKANNDFRAFEVGEQYLGQFATSPKAKDVLLSMSQMALVTVDYRRAAGYLAAFSQKFSNDINAKEYAKQSALLYEQLGDSEESSQMYSQLGVMDAAGNALFQAGDWKSLSKLAPRIGGVSGLYYQGVAAYRQNPNEDAIGLLKRASQDSPKDGDEKTMVAHASFLVAMQALQKYKQIGAGAGFTPQILQQKIAALQEFDRQEQGVVALGVGRWTIAALAMLGQSHIEFANFLRAAAPPAGMTKAQLGKVLDPQIKTYSQSASSYFSQCLKSAEEFDIFTRFVEACRTQGRVVVDESQDIHPLLKANKSLPENVETARKGLYKDPRNLNLLQSLAESYARAKDFPAARIVLHRMIELSPESAFYQAELGMIYMNMNQLDLALVNFKEALKKDNKESTALSGLAGIYRQFGFSAKRDQFIARAKSAGKPQGISHPWAQNLK